MSDDNYRPSDYFAHPGITATKFDRTIHALENMTAETRQTAILAACDEDDWLALVEIAARDLLGPKIKEAAERGLHDWVDEGPPQD